LYCIVGNALLLHQNADLLYSAFQAPWLDYKIGERERGWRRRGKSDEGKGKDPPMSEVRWCLCASDYVIMT